MEITKSHWLHWYFPTMTPWKPYSRNYDQSWEPSAGSLIRTPWWSFLSWEKFGQNKSQAFLHRSVTGARWGRPDDTVGLASAVNRISHQGKLYGPARRRACRGV